MNLLSGSSKQLEHFYKKYDGEEVRGIPTAPERVLTRVRLENRVRSSRETGGIDKTEYILRKYLINFQPHANDVEAWCRLCFGRLRPPARLGQDPSKIKSDLNTSENETDIKMDSDRETTDTDRPESSTTFPSHEGILPLVSVMVAMDQPTVLKVLEYHLNWFEATGFTERQGYWFYALLVSLDKPLIPDACSLLRGLARACSRLRASLESIDDPRLTPLNLFICLISRYFDQSDLMDRVT
ncbi:gem-associated protein 2-like [Ruditapes philippinarum]|uniref:gem-associated protein 2-like n=1 Tax=Ruditapes philippinarum TaxID=129788 RepID=UPI00295C355D|nr:gem-associated protein 2-like [Ruditapes philippinarum]